MKKIIIAGVITLLIGATPINAESVGRGQSIEDLVPQYGKSYEDNALIDEAVTFARRWNWQAAYENLDSVVQKDPDDLDAYRFKAELYLINKEYHHALAQLDEILRQSPTDRQALTLSAVTELILNNQESMERRLEALQIVDAELAEQVESVIARTLEVVYMRHDKQPEENVVADTVLIFGERPNKGGTLTKGLENKLIRTLELSQEFPDAQIFLSGGDVHTEFTEASVMKRWLMDAGVSEERIVMDELARDTVGNVWAMRDYIQLSHSENVVIVTKANHISRAYTLLTLSLEQVEFDGFIDAVSSDEPTIVSYDELLYTYINAFRTVNLFEKNDFTEILQ